MPKVLNTLLLTVFLGSLFSQVSSQGFKHPSSANYASPNWVIQDPFEQKVFIENNEGQFDGKNGTHGDKILFAARLTGLDIYFCASGITYSYTQYPVDQSEKDSRHKTKPYYFLHSIKWLNANPQVELLAQQEVNFYYTYPKSNKHTTIAHAFQKICYKNLYPGIDLEYSFSSEKKTLEYTTIVHPGADLSLFKIVFNDVQHILKNADGNIITTTSWGTFTEVAPFKTYYQESTDTIASSFSSNGNILSLSANYDHSKTLVIDPWTVIPTFSNYNAGYDVCYDLKGNVYAYGSFSPYQEIKVNSKGVIQWIYSIPNADPQYGDFAVDEATGISYDGSCTYPYVYKVDTLGIQTNSYWVNNSMEELWRMAFNTCENQLILTGGGVGLTNQACTLDTGLTKLNPVNVLGTNGAHHDMSLLTIENDNSSIFIGTAATTLSPLFANQVLRCMLPSLTPTTYFASDGFNFQETLPDANYINGVSGHTLAMNGAANSPNWLYFYDGSTLRRYHKSTGAMALTKVINPTPFTWGGIDVDICDNLYLGVGDTIKTYDSSLNNTGNILAPNHIYGLHVAPNNTLIATGLKFIASFGIVVNPVVISFKKTDATNCSNGGAATATINSCGNDSSTYSYKWSNGATTQTITGLAPGGYTITISSGCDFKYTDSVRIKNTSKLVVSIQGKKVICYGNSDTLTSSGGGPYLWNNGATTSSIIVSPTGTTTYSVQAGNGPCKGDTSITIIIDSLSPPKISGKDTICIGEQTELDAFGSGGNYLWSNGATTTSIIVSPVTSTTYTARAIGGCGSSSASIFVYVAPAPVPYFIADITEGCAPLCIQFKDYSTLNQGNIFMWRWKFDNGDTLDEENPRFCYPDTGKFTPSLTVVSNDGCSATIEIVKMITVYSKPIANFTYAPMPVTILEPTVQFTDNSSDIYGIAFRWWSFGDGQSIPPQTSIIDPTHTYKDTGIYCPQLVVENNKGCIDTVTNCLFVSPLFTLYIPSAFTPNTDGLNDLFQAKGTYIKTFEMYIFDRWGMELFHSTDINKGWDGTIHGNGVISQEDTYVYMITAADWNDTQHNYVGRVTLLK